LLRGAGLEHVQAGVLGAEWSETASEAETELEQATLRADLEGQISGDELEQLLAADRAAWTRAERVLYVPTFYAWGRAQ
jgi:hypothetical protein